MPAEPTQPTKRRRRSAPGTPPPVVRAPSLGVRSGSEGVPRLIAGLGNDSVDVTHPLTAAVAHAMWQLRGGEDIANWVDAERLVDRFLRAYEPTEGRVPEVVIPARRARATR